MIIARGTHEGDELIILGLSFENIKRLIAGNPIICRRKTHGDGIPEGWQISIMAGETEESLAEAFRKGGLIKPDTKFIKDQRLGKKGT